MMMSALGAQRRLEPLQTDALVALTTGIRLACVVAVRLVANYRVLLQRVLDVAYD